jgi:hypothetical protein
MICDFSIRSKHPNLEILRATRPPTPKEAALNAEIHEARNQCGAARRLFSGPAQRILPAKDLRRPPGERHIVVITRAPIARRLDIVSSLAE